MPTSDCDLCDVAPSRLVKLLPGVSCQRNSPKDSTTVNSVWEMQHLASFASPNVATAKLELIYLPCDDENMAGKPPGDKPSLNLNEVAFPLD